MAASKNSNPFFEEDEDDRSFEKKEKIQEQIFASEDRQLDSTMRALRSIQESEIMGVATAEELLRQGEQLNNIERKTDEINQTMTVTQKHLNNIKSVFGGIKNWWGAKKTSTATNEPETKPSRLQETLEKHRSDQPVRRNPDTRGFYQEDDDLDEDFMKGARTQQYFKPVTHSAREEQLNENLGQISNGLTTLKGLALGLGDEIEKQNNQLDRLGPKVGKANDLLEHQNKQMKTILRK